MSKLLGLMILLAHLKFFWRILNFAGAVFEAKVTLAKDLRQQNSAGTCQKISSLQGWQEQGQWRKEGKCKEEGDGEQ
jgi:hypothetical protein